MTADAAEAAGRGAGIGWSFVMKKHGCVAVKIGSNDVYSTNAPGCP
jgi:hypothetical protein